MVLPKPEDMAQVEELVPALEAVERAAKALRSTRLKPDTLVLLVRESLPRGFRSKLSHADVEAVLEAASRVATTHLKPPTK